MGHPGEMRLMMLTCLASPRITQSEWPGPCSTPLFGGELYRWRWEAAQDDFSRVREMLVVEAVSFW